MSPWPNYSNAVTYGSNNRAFLVDKQRSFLSNVLTDAVNNQYTYHNKFKATHLIQSLRGGSAATSDEEESDSEYEDQYDSEEEEEYDESTDAESDEEDQDEEAESLAASLQSKATDQPYDTLLTPPPMQQMLISISIMFLSQRIDIFSPKVVTIARAAFVGYIIAVQLFLLYVRTRVKQINNRTKITISNPLASLVEGMQQNNPNAMVKSLTSQILTQQTTIYEYDLQQIKSMQSSLLMPMVFIYFLHFRMKQMQPLLMQTVTGVTNLVYSPLWQVYVMGRNLERPFGKGAAGGGLEEMLGGSGDEGESNEASETEVAADEDEEGDIDVESEATDEEDSYDGENEETDED